MSASSSKVIDPMAERPLHELLSRSMVDIYVGSENTHWILHEKLLCARSAFFREIFYSERNNASSNKSFGLPDDDDEPFRRFVGWLYSGSVPPPREEADLGVLFELYLMGERWRIPGLRADSLDAVREWYAVNDAYPGLRRVQYVYSNTEDGSDMRALLVQSVARMLALAPGIPKHWDKALRKNGQLAVDIIRAVQQWHLEGARLPDARSVYEPSVLGSPSEMGTGSESSWVKGSTNMGNSEMTESNKGMMKELPPPRTDLIGGGVDKSVSAH